MSRGENEASIPSTKILPSSQNTLVLFSILYIAIFSNTLLIHNVFTRPFRQFHGPGHHFRRGDELKKESKGSTKYAYEEPMEDSITRSRDQSFLEEITDGERITSILLGESAFPTETKTQRLRFQPGKINLAQPDTLRYCYADPNIYTSHFPSSDRQVTSVSDTYELVYLMIPKSGSSTGRWIMERVLDAHDIGMNPAGNELFKDYSNFTVIIFVRDPLSRFYSQYDEVFLRYGPWMKRREGRAWKGLKNFQHPYPYLYENMTAWEDYEFTFCPRELRPDNAPHRTEWCSRQQTHENGTLAARFERFVNDYNGISSWDLVRSIE